MAAVLEDMFRGLLLTMRWLKLSSIAIGVHFNPSSSWLIPRLARCLDGERAVPFFRGRYESDKMFCSGKLGVGYGWALLSS